MKDYDYLNTMSSGIENIITYGNTLGALQGQPQTINGLLQLVFNKGTLLLLRRTLLLKSRQSTLHQSLHEV
jgi:hypothetical protein